MKKQLKLKIGEFSKLMQVTVKTLRHYEQLGLLIPDEVDPWTGYRYYRVVQMQKLNTILRLKEMGFALEEIRELYEGETYKPSLQQLNEKIEACETALRRLTIQRKQLQILVNSYNNMTQMDKFSMQTLPAIIVASHRSVINRYSDLGPLCVNVIGPEMQRLGCRCPYPGYCFTMEHTQEYTPTDIDIEYCEQVEEMGRDSALIQFKQLPEVPTALCMKHYGPYETLYQAYTEIFAYIEEQGYRIVGQPRANYVDGCWNQEDPAKWLTIIQVPVEKA
ncbi:MAG: MerR family transcriptional regulator [Parabacteroides sp.]